MRGEFRAQAEDVARNQRRLINLLSPAKVNENSSEQGNPVFQIDSLVVAAQRKIARAVVGDKSILQFLARERESRGNRPEGGDAERSARIAPGADILIKAGSKWADI